MVLEAEGGQRTLWGEEAGRRTPRGGCEVAQPVTRDHAGIWTANHALFNGSVRALATCYVPLQRRART